MKKRIMAAALVLLFFCALMPFAAYNLHMVLSKQISLCSADPAVVVVGLSIPQVRGFVFFGIALVALFEIWLLIGPTYIKYRNGMREIVPGLWIPEPAGQGQYGTARWMEPREYGSSFSVAVLDTNSALITSLIAHGEDDLKGGELQC